jgi:hypothetical protein
MPAVKAKGGPASRGRAAHVSSSTLGAQSTPVPVSFTRGGFAPPSTSV